MPQIVSFIGWHNSGKTTLATQVVSHLKEAGYRVAVIKSSKAEGIAFDTPGTDTDKHRQAGAESVLFMAPDQMALMADNRDLPLATVVHRYFGDMDIIIAEGFKQATRIAKIEVVRDSKQELRKEVSGVIAVATNLPDVTAKHLFGLEQSRQIASFIEERYLKDEKPYECASLLVNGKKIPLKSFVQDALAGTVAGFVKSLKFTENVKDIELRICLDDE